LDHNFGKDDLLDRIEDIGPIVAEKWCRGNKSCEFNGHQL
jgi:hypothetical protein